MRAVLFSTVVVFALLMGIAFADEVDATPATAEAPATDEAPPETNADGTVETPENPNFDMKRLKALCWDLDKTHRIQAAYKNHEGHEADILAKAAQIGHVMEDHMKEVEKRTHTDLNCADAKKILEHDAAKGFIDKLKGLVEESHELGITNQQMIANLKHMRGEFEFFGLVNDEVYTEIDDIVSDLEHLEKLYHDLKDDFNHVLNNEDCSKNFHNLIDTLNQLTGEKIPNWHHLDEGLHMLVQQCHEDPELHMEHENDL